MAKCPICGGTGNTKNIIGKPLTEQEYIQTCTTEQLAEWIEKMIDCDYCPAKKPCEKQPRKPCKEQIEEWLKQPQTFE